MVNIRDRKAYKKIKEKTEYFRRYFTHDNGERPFLVYFRGNYGFIYKRPEEKKDMVSDEEWEKGYGKEWAYTHLVKEFEYDKVFVGESPLNEMTYRSGGYGKEFKGNSIVFKLKKDGCKMLFVGDKIFEWRIDQEPVSYCSPVGNSDVPYPYLKTHSRVYFMLDMVYMPISLFSDYNDLYSEYYDMEKRKLKKESKPFKDLEIIHGRV